MYIKNEKRKKMQILKAVLITILFFFHCNMTKGDKLQNAFVDAYYFIA